MTDQSFREYKLIREEMKSVKDCITNYVGYMLGGSGAAIFGFTALAATKGSASSLAFPALLMSLLIAMVLLIIFYKFHSHNRFAGYCMLLSHEEFKESELPLDIPIFSWETCLKNLREADTNPDILYGILNRTKFDEAKRKSIEEKLKKYESDARSRKRYWLGMKQLLRAFLGRVSTKSWGFPPYIAAVFFVLCTGFWAVGIYFSFFDEEITKATEINREMVILWLVAVSITIILGALLFSFCRRLYFLMDGRTTVEAFFWRFMPIRERALGILGISSDYQDPIL